MRRFAWLVPAVLFFMAAEVSAQAHVRAGGFLGVQHDRDEDWLIFGAEARLRGGRMHFDVQPRFHYQPGDGFSVLQLDGNLLFNFASAVSQVVPYMGFGAAFNRLSVDEDIPGADLDETNVGINLVSGLILGTNPAWRPYAQFQYTLINDYPNSANLAIGILFNLRGTYR